MLTNREQWLIREAFIAGRLYTGDLGAAPAADAWLDANADKLDSDADLYADADLYEEV